MSVTWCVSELCSVCTPVSLLFFNDPNAQDEGTTIQLLTQVRVSIVVTGWHHHQPWIWIIIIPGQQSGINEIFILVDCPWIHQINRPCGCDEYKCTMFTWTASSSLLISPFLHYIVFDLWTRKCTAEQDLWLIEVAKWNWIVQRRQRGRKSPVNARVSQR